MISKPPWRQPCLKWEVTTRRRSLQMSCTTTPTAAFRNGQDLSGSPPHLSIASTMRNYVRKSWQDSERPLRTEMMWVITYMHSLANHQVLRISQEELVELLTSRTMARVMQKIFFVPRKGRSLTLAQQLFANVDHIGTSSYTYSTIKVSIIPSTPVIEIECAVQYYCGAEGFLHGLPGQVKISEQYLLDTVLMVRAWIHSVSHNKRFHSQARELMEYYRNPYQAKGKIPPV